MISLVMSSVWTDIIPTKPSFSGEKKNSIFNCHEIARAWYLHSKKLKYVDGVVGGFGQCKEIEVEGQKQQEIELVWCGHSRLLTPDGAIVDPYPVGAISFGALLIPNCGDYRPYGGGLYVPTEGIVDGSTKQLKPRNVWRRANVLAGLIGEARIFTEKYWSD